MKTLRILTIFLFILSLALYLGISFRYNVTLDRVSPQIQCNSEVLGISVKADDSALLAGVTAKDDRDGDLTDQIMVQGISRLLTDDTVRITYVVMDSSDNIGSCTRSVRFTDYERPRLQLTQLPVYSTYTTDNVMAELFESLSAEDLRDGDISDQIQISVQQAIDDTEIDVSVQITNSLGDSEVVPLTIVIDNDGAETPLVTLDEYITYVDAGSAFDPKDCVRTLNGSPSSGANPGLRIDSQVDTAVPGAYQVRYQYQSFTVYQTVVVR